MSDAFKKMDSMYRLQRYFYDFTRKYYLLGRDRLLNEMTVNDGDHVLEAGCGTARNLIILARRYPNAHFYGLDASAAMLETAKKKADAAGVKNITFKTALADNFSFDETFGLSSKFDTIFFSYSISMIPPWLESINNAVANLSDKGTLYIVDFYDQAELYIFAPMLKWWLSKFHVTHWEGLIPFINSLNSLSLKAEVTPLFRRYSFISKISKTT